MRIRQVFTYPFCCPEEINRIPAVLFHAGSYREYVGVKNYVFRRKAYLIHKYVIRPFADIDAPLVGIGLAFLGRIILLLTITWIIGLSKPFFHIDDFAVSYRDLILILGGLFLVGKSTSEIHARIEGTGHKKTPKKLSLGSALLQILILDVVFSLDSIITAIGLSDVLLTMIIAIVISLGIMLLFMNRVSEFIQKHPAMKILAIAFLIMIGTVLVIEGLHVHVPKGYIYVSMAFALGIEFLNMWIRKKDPGPKAVLKETVEVKRRGSKV